MTDENRALLEMLKFELRFLEEGGYGRSPRTPWKPTRTFQDSPSCRTLTIQRALIPAVSAS